METGGNLKKGAEGRKGGGPKKKPVSRSVKAGLQFSVGRIDCYLEKGRYAMHVGTDAPVSLTAVLEYLAAEVLVLAGNAARDRKNRRIIPRHVLLALRNEEELGELLSNINLVLLPKKSRATNEPKSPSKAANEIFAVCEIMFRNLQIGMG
uniref:Histone H2A n=1 Tax=Davidia involucrata TaxID=16924 RepID=A0A5B6ZSG2_DAVIN